MSTHKDYMPMVHKLIEAIEDLQLKGVSVTMTQNQQTMEWDGSVNPDGFGLVTVKGKKLSKKVKP